jgi:hypothetical protein
LAAAGDRHAIVRVRAAGPAAGFSNAWIVSVEISDDGTASALHVWDLDDMRLAFADCRRRYLAGEPQLTEATRHDHEFEVIWNQHDIDSLVAMLNDDFRVLDHRATSLLDEIDREEWHRFQVATIAELPRIASWMNLISCKNEVTFVRHRRWSDPALDPDWDFYVVSLWGPDGTRTGDLYYLDQDSQARSRFEELVAGGAATLREPEVGDTTTD